MENEHIIYLTCENEAHARCRAAQTLLSGRKRVEQFDRFAVKSFWISDLQGSRKWQVTQRYLTNWGIKARHWPICVRIDLCTGGKKNTTPLFKIHQLTWKWQGRLCALTRSHPQWLHFLLCCFDLCMYFLFYSGEMRLWLQVMSAWLSKDNVTLIW